METTLKRPLNGLDDASSVDRKKRQRSDSATPTTVVKNEDDKDDLSSSIELFQKEAIYRQLLEYRRLSTRSQSKIHLLQSQKDALLVKLECVELGWKDVVANIKSLLPTTEGLEMDVDVKFDPADSLEKIIDRRSQSTKELIKNFVALATSSSLHPPSSAGTPASEVLKLKSMVSVLETQLEEAKRDNERLEEEIKKAEKKFDRVRCKTVADPTGAGVKQEDQANGVSSPQMNGHSSNGNGTSTPNESSSAQPSPPSIPTLPVSDTPLHPSTAAAEAVVNAEDLSYKKIAESREEIIHQLRSEVVALEKTRLALTGQVNDPTEDRIMASPMFKILQTRLSYFQVESTQFKAEHAALQQELSGLRISRQAFQDKLVQDHEAQLEVIQEASAKKDSDLIRLRAMRDEIHAELGERKAKEEVKLKHANECVGMAESRKLRIATLASEVTRLKAALAANSSLPDILSYFLTPAEVGQDVSVIESQQTQLKSYQSKIKALEDQLESLLDKEEAGKVLAENELGLRTEIENMNGKLKVYETTFGTLPSSSSIVGTQQELVKQLEAKEAERQKLELKVAENDMSINALYSEVDSLSKAWTALDSQLQSKVFNLKDLEDKVTRLITEKSKADNKYFSAMRAHDSTKNELKVIAATVKTQATAMAHLNKMEENLNAQIFQYENELATLRSNLTGAQDWIAKLEREAIENHFKFEKEHSRVLELNTLTHTKTDDVEKARSKAQHLKEEVDKFREQNENLKKKNQTLLSQQPEDRNSDVKEEKDKLMAILKCSTCSMRLRSHCITKCMHTFCKDCIDARISTRQRKCPACNLPFATSDVQPIWFQ